MLHFLGIDKSNDIMIIRKNPTSISTCEVQNPLVAVFVSFRQNSGGARHLCEGESFYSPELAIHQPQDGVIKLRRSLADCPSVRREI